MTRFALSHVRHHPWRAATLALGIISASVAFVLLTSSARTSTISVKQTVRTNFRGAYDLLVRPRNSYTQLERARGLVRDNYLSGIYGGITRAQYETIRHVPGVAVAAPIANVGTVLAHGAVVVPLRKYVTPSADQLFRVKFAWVGDRGLSHYPGTEEYLYVTRRRLSVLHEGSAGWVAGARDEASGALLPVCSGYAGSNQAVIAPFVPSNSSLLGCVSTNRSPELVAEDTQTGQDHSLRNAVVTFDFTFPVNVAAIDPSAEAQLVALDHTIVRGKYLSDHAHPTAVTVGTRVRQSVLSIPALESSQTVVDETLHAVVERLRIPKAIDLPRVMAAGACPNLEDTCAPSEQLSGPPGAPGTTARAFLTALSGQTVARKNYTARSAYASALLAPASRSGFLNLQHVSVNQYWTSSSVAYRSTTPTLHPIPVRNSRETWRDVPGAADVYVQQPTDNLDLQFRGLVESVATPGNGAPSGQVVAPELRPVGLFDPARLPGFSPLSRLPLETYYAPTLTPATPRTARELHGHDLLPNQNIAGYQQQPPLLLINLDGLDPLLSPARFSHVSRRQRAAPISVIRVRVRGVTGPNQLSEERIKAVAQLIHERTGLGVDVTAGSSPTQLRVALPAGRFGRPALSLSEGWVKTGVAVRYVEALDRKDITLFGLVLIVCSLFLMNGTMAAVRARRAEIGLLRTFGWTHLSVFRVIVGEAAAVGLTSGIIGSALAVGIARTFALSFPLVRSVYVVPVSVLMAVAAAAWPAWRAAGVEPTSALTPEAHTYRRKRARNLASLALVNLIRVPARTAVGAVPIAVAVASLGVLLAIQRAFAGELIDTLLGAVVTVQIRRSDYIAEALVVILAAVAVADVVYLNARERQAETAVLRASGWSRRDVLLIGVAEALGISLAGALLGLLSGMLVAVLLHVPLGACAAGGAEAATVSVAVAVSLGASAVVRAASADPAAILADE